MTTANIKKIGLGDYMIELLLKLEMSLWINETRGNYEYMNHVLHPDFIEFGRSGKTYIKEDILKDMEVDIKAVFPFPNLAVKQIEETTYLVTYISVLDRSGKKEYSNRSSIWIANEDQFKLIHHQGTPTKEIKQ